MAEFAAELNIRNATGTNALLEFWFEFASTYSYPVAMSIGKRAAAAGVEVSWKPFLLGPIFANQGWTDSPFNLYPAKGAYMWKDLERICRDANLGWSRPSQFPRNGLLAARVAYANENESWIGSFVTSVYAANFSCDEDIADPSVIEECLQPLVSEPKAVLAAAERPEIKSGLRERTEAAATLQIFGSPSFLVAGELFWGGDRLEQAIQLALRRSTTLQETL